MRFLIFLLLIILTGCTSSRQVHSTASETSVSHTEADTASESHSESISNLLLDRDCIFEDIVIEYSSPADSSIRASPPSCSADTPKVIRIAKVTSKSSLSASQTQSSDASSAASAAEDSRSQSDEVVASNISSSTFHPSAYLIILVCLALSGWLYYRYRRLHK